MPSRAPQALAGSFRDPAGFVYKTAKAELLRQVNQVGKQDFDLFIQSGLYDALVKDGLIVSHKSLPLSEGSDDRAVAVLKPKLVPYITYPFEWSFSQLQDAALLTLTIQKRALKHGMTLKDASAYNVQFLDGKPVFIDTLSFEKYTPGTPWQAYKQFCQHFLAPLALMAYTDLSLLQLLRIHLDGIPLELASRLLPRTAKLKAGLAMHIVLHGRAQKAKANDHQAKSRQLKQTSLEAILDSLERIAAKLKPRTASTEWGDYYDKTNYTTSAADKKAALVHQFVKPLKAKSALDLGGNNGTFSRVLHTLGIFTVCSDIDPVAVEVNYRYMKLHGERTMLPMLVDLTNPGGALGWANGERQTVHERLQCDVVMALALIHHLAISNNLPLTHIAGYFSKFAEHLVIEFVPKQDSQVKKLLATRKDIFPDYTEDGFKKAFGVHYVLQKEANIAGTKRTLYLFRRNSGKSKA